MSVPDTLRVLLACPNCRQPLTDGPAGSSLDCHHCRLRFKVRDGIPVLLAAEAERLDP